MKRRILVPALCILASFNTACGSSDFTEDVGEVESALSGTVLLVASSTTLSSADNAVRNRLQGLGFTVQVKAASATTSADATGKALVVVSSTVSPSSVGTKFRDVTVPVLTWEAEIYDDMQLTPAGNFGTRSSQRNLTITSPGHPMAAGLSGTVVATSSTRNFSWGRPAAAAVRIASLATSPVEPATFGYDAGSSLANGQPAPARRVGLFLSDTTATALTTNGWLLFDEAVEWAVGGAQTGTNVVALNVTNVDDFLYVTVNGIRRKVVPWQNNISETISDWFMPGTNSVRLQAINTGGPASYSVQISVDGAVVVDANCANAPCTPVVGGTGILFDQTYQVTTPNRPAARTLTVNGTSGGRIYLNDAYTGFTVPRTFTLPQGQYTVGLGVGEGVEGAYVGQFHEQTVQLAANNVTVTPSQLAPLSQPNHTRIALLPIRQTFHGNSAPENVGVLSANDITVMHGQTIATREQYLEPFSYNLTTWDVDLLPTVETTPLHRTANSGDAGDTGRLLLEAGLTHLLQQYDTIIYYYSKFTASGAVVANDPCCWWGIGQGVWFPNHISRGGATPNQPNVYLLHEMLHDYESYNDSRLHFYNGAGGLHGGGQHGYVGGDGGEFDYLLHNRRFMRNQLAELNTMRGETPWTVGHTDQRRPLGRSVRHHAPGRQLANVRIRGHVARRRRPRFGHGPAPRGRSPAPFPRT